MCVAREPATAELDRVDPESREVLKRVGERFATERNYQYTYIHIRGTPRFEIKLWSTGSDPAFEPGKVANVAGSRTRLPH
jgi:hypothetical protein